MSENAYMYIIRGYEGKLRELMPDDEYKKFTEETADKALELFTIGMIDSKFLDYIMEHKGEKKNEI